MSVLSPIPEIGLVTDNVCDICMIRQPMEYFSCGNHKICNHCIKRFSGYANCPLCTKYCEHCIEKSMGHSESSFFSFTAPSYNINIPVSTEEEDNIPAGRRSSDPSLDSISSFDFSLSDSEDMELEHSHVPQLSETFVGADCSLDKKQLIDYPLPNSKMGQNSLSSVIMPIPTFSSNVEKRNGEVSSSSFALNQTHDNDPNRDKSDSSNTCEETAVSKKRRLLRKSKPLSSFEFQKMIDLCKDL